MPRSDVAAKSSVFISLCEGNKQEAVARRLGISVGTLRSLRRGDKVSRGLIEYLSEKMQRPVLELLEIPTQTLIPADVAFFEGLQFGWFIDNDRRSSGSAQWYRETVKLRHVAGKKNRPGSLTFTGSIVNQFNETFQVTGERLNDYHFSLTGVSKPSKWSFDASFTLRLGDVLCGTWSGMNHLASSMAVYRLFFSTAELTLDDLQRLTQKARIECLFEADSFA